MPASLVRLDTTVDRMAFVLLVVRSMGIAALKEKIAAVLVDLVVTSTLAFLRAGVGSDASVCTDCSDGWQCLDTAPECFLAGLCIFPSDCSGGLICVDDGACGPCEVDEQCPDQICESGVCTDPAPPDPVDPGGPAVNRTCADDAECDAFDGVRKCSTTQDPRRCTKSCSNNGQCRSDGFNTCTNGECTGVSN